ncbi:DUF4349 domain-containing protein [Emticicia sp. C21]|uniref:DUF4349 domain-containing protein n=1 Tax=Emticicia sp. C21 TaxID=2302915 RepID=UPI000E34431D|nr:DUF4349 domain-containing protein [Emticicia sp. C21]RFS16633.1 DUF4349 domain-containing protein [Emticicia sp. C21]
MRFYFLSKAALFGAMGCFFMACSSKVDSDFKAEQSDIAADTVIVGEKEETPNTPANPADASQRKFLRTADMQFKVKDVRKSSEQIEDLTNKYGGFVTYSHMHSDEQEKKTVIISEDSLLNISLVTVENDIIIRVPNQHLPSILKELNSMMLYVDYRTIKAEDVRLQILSNDLANKRQEKFVDRNQSVHKDRKENIGTAVEAEETLLDHQTVADNHKIQNLSLQDQVDFSTLTIKLYQAAFLSKVMVENRQHIDNYRPNVFMRIWDSVKTGWMFLEDVIVILMRLWVFILLGGVGVFYWQSRKKTQDVIKS